MDKRNIPLRVVHYVGHFAAKLLQLAALKRLSKYTYLTSTFTQVYYLAQMVDHRSESSRASNSRA